MVYLWLLAIIIKKLQKKMMVSKWFQIILMSYVKQLKQSNNEANKNNFMINNNGKNKKF